MIRWLASFPKSGNTWCRHLLSAYIDGDDFDINRVPDGILQDTATEWWHFASPIPLRDLKEPSELALLRNTVLLSIAKRFENPVVKTHCANVFQDNSAVIPPYLTELAIYVLRDPRDVVVSYADHLGLSIDETIGLMADGNHVMLDMKAPLMHLPTLSWSQHVSSWTEEGSEAVHVVQYEELQKDAAAVLRDMIGWLGWELHEDRVQKAVELTEFSRLQKIEAEDKCLDKSPHQERFFREGKTGRWREVLSEMQIRRIERDHGDVMRRFGYNPALLAA